MNSRHILITGATGLIGTRLTELLLQRGYSVVHLSRSRDDETKIRTFLWDVERSWIEPGVFDDIDCIIHLAGAGIADKPWSEKRKQEIIDSRVKSCALLHHELKDAKHKVKCFISASAIGYYGTSDVKFFKEADPPGEDFLANVAYLWEQEAEKFESLGIRVAKIRTGLVLSNPGGLLEEFVKPIKWYVGAPLGNGNQWMSWIHIDDLCRIYLHALETETLNGPVNAVAPNPVTNRDFVKCVAKMLKRPILFPPIPKFVLKFLLGEMVTMAVDGNRVSSFKIEEEGFKFEYKKLDNALRNLLNKSQTIN